jgi:hypothetical protein
MSEIKEQNQNGIEISTNLQKNEFDQHNPSLAPPSIESSMEEILNVPTFLKFAGRQAAECACSILGPQGCTTTCLSSEQPCGGGCSYCTRTSVFEACPYLIGPDSIHFGIYSFLSVDNKDCEKLLVDCSIASSTILAAGRVAAIAVGIAGGLSAGIAVAAVAVASSNNQTNNNDNNENQQPAQISNQTPVNNSSFPVVGICFPDDGSGDSSIRFPDGSSHPVFSRGPCNQTQWVTVDPISLKVSIELLQYSYYQSSNKFLFLDLITGWMHFASL